jgi:transcriptional regulator
LPLEFKDSIYRLLHDPNFEKREQNKQIDQSQKTIGLSESFMSSIKMAARPGMKIE